MSSFKTLEAAFDFSRCLQCQELQLEHYGSSSESPCMACLGRVKKIKERNALHRLDPFDGAQARH